MPTPAGDGIVKAYASAPSEHKCQLSPMAMSTVATAAAEW
jgi:hypothetical protein